MFKRLVMLVIAMPLVGPAHAELREVDPPRHVTLTLADGGDRVGRVTSFDAESLTLLGTTDGEPVRVRWTHLTANSAFVVYQSLMDKALARDWLDLGTLLMAMPEGGDQGESALQVAVLLDETLAEEADAARASRPEPAPSTPPTGDRRDSSQALFPEPVLPADVPPQQADAANATWNDVAPEQFEQLVEREKAMAGRVGAELGVNLNLIETDYFLLYTDLDPKDAYEWQRVLDLMYQRVSYLLEIPEGVNVFKGKATVFLFKHKEQFVAFEREFYQNQVTFEAGICHQHFTGEVRIAFHQIDDELQMKQIMIHEAAHGVIHRYRSPRRVTSWLNEGIAEWTAFSVVNYKQPYKWKKRESANVVKQRGRFDPAFFDDDNYKADYYGTSLAMVELLLRRGRPRFIAFVNGIKDGLTWQESLLEHYEMTPDDLISAYGRSIGMRDLSR